jgi:hypothetical protein
MKYGFVVLVLTEKLEHSEENSVSLPHRPPQIPHKLMLD